MCICMYANFPHKLYENRLFLPVECKTFNLIIIIIKMMSHSITRTDCCSSVGLVMRIVKCSREDNTCWKYIFFLICYYNILLEYHRKSNNNKLHSAPSFILEAALVQKANIMVLIVMNSEIWDVYCCTD